MCDAAGASQEHKATVNSLKVRNNDLEFVSASSDGSCIIWDMRRFARNNSLFASTFFKAVLYHPDESQLLTTGTDRKITNWDAYDGNAIRIVDGSTSAEVGIYMSICMYIYVYVYTCIYVCRGWHPSTPRACSVALTPDP